MGDCINCGVWEGWVWKIKALGKNAKGRQQLFVTCRQALFDQTSKRNRWIYAEFGAFGDQAKEIAASWNPGDFVRIRYSLSSYHQPGRRRTLQARVDDAKHYRRQSPESAKWVPATDDDFPEFED